MLVPFADAGFPPLVAGWLQAALPDGVPLERAATCASCAMATSPPREDDAAQERVVFDPLMKCCSFLPRVPNYLVGQLLADDSPDMAVGCDAMLRRVRAGVGVTPMGVGRSRAYNALYSGATFGRAIALRCPYQTDEGRCGMWRHREATCSTWYCKHEHGLPGRRFWSTLQDLMWFIEHQLARDCAVTLGYHDDALAAIGVPGKDQPSDQRGVEDLDVTAHPAFYHALWGAWDERQEDYFRACGERVAGLAWPDVAAVCGAALPGMLDEVRAALAIALEPRPPELVVLRRGRNAYAEGDGYRVTTYSNNDQLVLAAPLAMGLKAFDGRTPTAAVVERLRDAGVAIDLAEVRRLVNFAVLAEVVPRPPGREE